MASLPPLPNLPKIALSRNQILIIAGAVLLILIVWLAFFFSASPTSTFVPVNLTVWGTDPREAFDAMLASYRALRPQVTVTYTQISAAKYDDTLLNALAAGKGPDVFMIGNHDVLKKLSLLAPADPSQMTPSLVDQLFPAAVGQDFSVKGKVYAMPLYMDVLSLVYNKESFDQAGIALPPTTWQDFNDDVRKLREVSPNGQIIKAATALGGSENSVRHATDILSLLMLQNGVQISDQNGQAVFAGSAGNAAASLRFYLQFADSGSPLYTWNEDQPDSLESFLQGKVAMAFAYGPDIANFKAKSPFLNFGVAPVPQVSQDHGVNYPSYQGLAVALRSASPGWAWDFVTSVTGNADRMRPYLVATGRGPALRSMLTAASSLTARSWPIPDYAAVQDIFDDAITEVRRGAVSAETALSRAQDQINQL